MLPPRASGNDRNRPSLTRRDWLARLTAAAFVYGAPRPARARSGNPAAPAAATGRGVADVPAMPARLHGTFIQLQTSHLAWRRADWERLFQYFDQLKLQRLVIQWTAHDGIAFHRPLVGGAAGNIGESTVGILLDLAAARGLNVLVGLDSAQQYWQALSAGAASSVSFLREAAARSLALAQELKPLVRDHPAFAGWYLSEEIDDETWGDEAMRRTLLAHLSAVRARLQALTPTAPVAISGFTNARNQPTAVAAFWASVLDGAGIDLLLMQDGIGTHKVRLEQLPAYLAAMAAMVTEQQRTMWVVAELFEQVGGPPIDDGSFRARPAALERIRSQLDIAAACSPVLIGFSVPEYMSPLGDLDAGRLFRRYRREVIGAN